MKETPTAFRIPRGAAIEEIHAALCSAGTLEKGRAVSENNLCLDSFDWRLFRRGLVLEAPPGGGSGPVSLRELGTRSLVSGSEGSAPRFLEDFATGRLRDILEPVLEMRALTPVARIQSRVTPLILRNKDGKIVLRLRIENGRVFPAEGGAGRSLGRRIHLLPVKGYTGVRKRVARLLLDSMSFEALGEDMLVEALAALGRTPGDYTSKIRISLKPSQPAREAAAAILLSLLKMMEANEEGILNDVDSEFLHDFRVAVRRTRAALGQLRKVFPPRQLERFRREFSWLGSTTGPGRDMDVYLLDFPHYRDELPPEMRADLDPLRDFLEIRRKEEYRAIAGVLRSARYRRLKESWRAFLEKPLTSRSRPAEAHRPIAEVASRRIRKVYRLAMREGEAIDASSPPEALHELRITCKKLRYLLEFFQSLYDPGAMKHLIGSLKGLQDNLGRYQDLHVQSESLQLFSRSMAAGGSAPPATFVAMGMLVEGKKGMQEECRREFSRRFKAFASPANRGLFKKLFRPPRAGAGKQ